MDDVRIGSVPYANALPLTRGLLSVETDVPSRLAVRFRAGEFDVALLPSFEVLRLGDRPIVPAGCIASEGPVDSVLLFSREALREARTVRLDRSSLTSAALTKVLFRGLFSREPEYRSGGPETDPRHAVEDAVLLIGDPALIAPRDGLVVSDLATMWREWTGLPFCFAVWVARDASCAARVAGPLAAARERGRLEREEVVREAAARTGLSRERMRRYLGERIHHEFGDRERESLRHFGKLCRDAGLLR
ncbi:MAG: menaquinone biosynthesis protein [Planctomycetes bacterium]|jgi:chorismate dehydratase|nr:menaquinone biosynthesis protein [Planctomycetota bacterium]